MAAAKSAKNVEPGCANLVARASALESVASAASEVKSPSLFMTCLKYVRSNTVEICFEGMGVYPGPMAPAPTHLNVVR